MNPFPSDDPEIPQDKVDPDGEHEDADESMSEELNKLYGGENGGS